MKVLATRPEKQNSPWINLLQQAGLQTVAAPLIELVPVADAQAVQQLKNKVLALNEYRALIFVSQNAVTYGLEWIDRYWPQLPSGLSWFAVGAKTAKCLFAHPLLKAECIVAAREQMNTEELLRVEGLQAAQVAGHKVLIFRGRGGRTLLGDTLAQRGALVEHCELYTRAAPRQLAQVSFAAADTLAPVFSGEALQNFFDAFCQNVAVLREVTLVVPGERVFQLAVQLGFERVHMASNAGEQAMLDGIKKALRH